MGITIEHIQGSIVTAIPIILFLILHFIIDKGKLTINKKDYNISAELPDGGGGFSQTTLSEQEDARVKIKLNLRLLLSNSGKRKLSVNTFQIENSKLEQPIILTPKIVELDVGTTKEESFNIRISYKEANILIYNNSKLRLVDNKGKNKTIKIGQAST